eukprot:gene29278-12521_t
MTHLLSIIVLLLKIRATKSCRGVSLKTQELYAIVFVTRYLDLFTTFISTACEGHGPGVCEGDGAGGRRGGGRSYRALYILNWIYRYITEPHYQQYLVWISGIVQTIIYLDFFYYFFVSWRNNKKLVLPKLNA